MLFDTFDLGQPTSPAQPTSPTSKANHALVFLLKWSSAAPAARPRPCLRLKNMEDTHTHTHTRPRNPTTGRIQATPTKNKNQTQQSNHKKCSKTLVSPCHRKLQVVTESAPNWSPWDSCAGVFFCVLGDIFMLRRHLFVFF